MKKKKRNMIRRGTVGYFLKMESQYYNIKEEEQEKEEEEEQEEEEDVLGKSGRSCPEPVEPSSHPTPSLSLIPNTTTEAEDEMLPEIPAAEQPEQPEEPTTKEVLPSMPVFDI